MENKISQKDLESMEIHEVKEVHDAPYFRVMRVVGGWLYSFYNAELDEYSNNWIFIPQIP